MPDAAARLCGIKKNNDVWVSVDGTWQRKVFLSTLEVVTAISVDSGKVLAVAILYINNGEKAALDIKELLKFDPGCYKTKSCSSVNIHCKHSSIYRVSEARKNVGRCCRHFKEKQKDKNIETEGTSYEKGSF